MIQLLEIGIGVLQFHHVGEEQTPCQKLCERDRYSESLSHLTQAELVLSARTQLSWRKDDGRTGGQFSGVGRGARHQITKAKQNCVAARSERIGQPERSVGWIVNPYTTYVHTAGCIVGNSTSSSQVRRTTKQWISARHTLKCMWWRAICVVVIRRRRPNIVLC